MLMQLFPLLSPGPTPCAFIAGFYNELIPQINLLKIFFSILFDSFKIKDVALFIFDVDPGKERK
jgi:hypothetical protein